MAREHAARQPFIEVEIAAMHIGKLFNDVVPSTRG
jgi:hypothetical protein